MIPFNNYKVRKYLIDNGVVFTCRKSGDLPYTDIAYYGSVDNKTLIGVVSIMRITPIESKDMLMIYSGNSGFDDVDEWMDTIKKFRYKFPLWLYRVQLVKT